jgi:hypothetical protein
MQDFNQQADDDRVIGVETFGEQPTQAQQPEQPRESVDTLTGEITTDDPALRRAADGLVVPATARSAGSMLDLLEDGAFSAEAYEQVRNLLATMTDISAATGGKSKGKITLTIDVTKDGEAFTMQGKVVVKTPELPRPKSIMWTDDRGDVCRFPPNQVQMFGNRPLRRI